MITTFITVAASVVLAVTTLRIVLIVFVTSQDYKVKLAESMGYNPVGEALFKTGLWWLASFAWIMTMIFG